MGNMTVSDLAMVVDATGDGSPAVHDGAARTIGLFIVTVLLVGLALFVVLTFCGFPLLGFLATGPAAGSIAAAWMSSIGVVAAGSLFSLLQMISMGGLPVAVVLLGIVAVVAAAVGAFEAIVWLFHAIDLLGWWHSATDWVVHLWSSFPSLLHVWHSATDWVVHLWDSIPSPLGWWHSVTDWVVHLWDSIPSPLGWWHSATDWVAHLWDSIPAHHKWKILYT